MNVPNKRRPLVVGRLLLLAVVLVLGLAAFAVLTAAAQAPAATPVANLSGSYKVASQRAIAPGQPLTYTIHLVNSGLADATANVADKVPGLMTYVDGSAAVEPAMPVTFTYHADTGTLTWDGVVVPMAGDVALSFQVTGATVTTPTVVTNVAAIQSTNAQFVRQATVVLTPEPGAVDLVPPTVRSLTIDDQDVLADPNVIIHINAFDDVGVTQMRLREWVFQDTPPYWKVVTDTEWMPFQADLPWTLGDSAGVHFVGVWVADAAGNTSLLDWNSTDYADLLVPDSEIAPAGVVPYLVYYPTDTAVSASIQATDSVKLFSWGAWNWGVPAVVGTSVNFTTPKPGPYLFAAWNLGTMTETYTINISPAGGPRRPVAPTPGAPAMTAQSDNTTAMPSVLFVAPMSPLGTATAPAAAPNPPAPTGTANLAHSFKVPSQRVLGPGQTTTYTIHLVNSGIVTATASVADKVPDPLTFVPGSIVPASGALITKTVTWDGVVVPPASQVELSFQVMAPATVAAPASVTNVVAITAKIDDAGSMQMLTRKAVIFVVPQMPTGDLRAPVVNSVTIGSEDFLTSPQTTLHIDATDNVGVTNMQIGEWRLDTVSKPPHWVEVTRTAWLPFAADIPWTLAPVNGIHYVGVWVRDAAGNTSRLDRNSIDYASLAQPNATVPPKGKDLFLVKYTAGTTVNASLAASPDTGAYLFEWNALHLGLPTNWGVPPTPALSFTADHTGPYLFAVYNDGAANMTYTLTLSPTGGPRLATSGPVPTVAFDNPLAQTGIDPLALVPAEPRPFAARYLPIVRLRR